MEIQFADELDEMWVDELYELGEALRANDDAAEEDKRYAYGPVCTAHTARSTAAGENTS